MPEETAHARAKVTQIAEATQAQAAAIAERQKLLTEQAAELLRGSTSEAQKDVRRLSVWFLVAVQDKTTVNLHRVITVQHSLNYFGTHSLWLPPAAGIWARGDRSGSAGAARRRQRPRRRRRTPRRAKPSRAAAASPARRTRRASACETQRAAATGSESALRAESTTRARTPRSDHCRTTAGPKYWRHLRG